MRRIKITILLLGLSGFLPGHNLLAADDWVLKGENFSLSRQLLDRVLTARGFAANQLPPKQKNALFQELFIRESLLAQQDEIPATVMMTFEQKLDDYRRGQLAKLTLDVLSEKAMPDFSKRARELYEVRKDEQYQLPLRLRVRVLRQSIEQPLANGKGAVADLQALLARIHSGELAFEQAVMQHSDDPDRKLTGGDSFWFQQGQVPKALFAAAEKLNAQNRLSEVVVDDEFAYILQYIGRQEAVLQSFAEVKTGIMQELQAEYRNDQRKLLLTELRAHFRNNVEIHPDFK